SDAQRIFPMSPQRLGYSRRTAAQRIQTSGNGEKIRFLKQKKHSYLAPRGLPKSPDRQRGKRESVGKPTLSTGCYYCLMLNQGIDGSRSSPSELQWIDSSDRGVVLRMNVGSKR